MHFRQIYIEITNECNLSCSFCVQNHQNIRYLSIEKFERILKQVKPYTSYIYLHVLGEPLLHPKMEQILKLCKQYGFYVNITTNGTLLKKQKELLQKYPVRQINVSLHSFSWQSPEIQKYYMKDVMETCDALSDTTYISYRLWCMRDGVLDKEASEILGQLKKHYQCETLVKDTLAPKRYISFEEVFRWPSLNDSICSTTGFCRGLKDMFAILSNGDVVPCCLDAYAQEKLGNVFKQDLDFILQSQRVQDIRQGFYDQKIKSPLCQRCQYRLRFNKKKGSH